MAGATLVLTNIPGDGTLKAVTDTSATNTERFYRILVPISRNNSVGSGERARPACCQRRPAVGLAFPLITHRF